MVRGTRMLFAINHIHLKAVDPRRSAEWWVKAFNFTIVNDTERANGVRFIACDSENGVRVNISSEPAGDVLRPGDAGLREGLEHFGFDSAGLERDIERLSALGATLVEGPRQGSVSRVCFLEVPDHIRIELIERK